MLLFELYLNAELSQSANGSKRIQRVSGKAGDALGEDDVDMSRFTFSHQALEFRSVCARAADAVVCENSRIFPTGISLDKRAVITDLC